MNRCLERIAIVRVIGVLLVVLSFGPVVPWLRNYADRSAEAAAEPVSCHRSVQRGSANTVVFVRSTDVVVIDTKGPRPVGTRDC